VTDGLDKRNPSGICMCGCGRPAPLAKTTHARRGYRKGEPLSYIAGHYRRGRLPIALDQRYVVNEATGCWEWIAYRDQCGYGWFRHEGRMHPAHRVTYKLHVGPIPEGHEIDHLCSNRGCVNPQHLQAVSHTENVRRSAAAKLTPAAVREIRASAAMGIELAARFGVVPSVISAIRRGHAWKDINAEEHQ
jgi:hypothetical protein